MKATQQLDAFARFERLLEAFEKGMLCLLLLGLIAVGLAEMVSRNLFDHALPWADGAMRAMVLALAMVAATVAAGRLKHFRIVVIERWMAPPLRRLVHSLLLLGTAGVCLAMSWFSLSMIAHEFRYQAIAFGGVPVWLVQMIVPAGFVMMAARFAAHGLSPAPEDSAPKGEAASR